MNKKRIQIYTDEETKRRVELAAAKHNMPLTMYCLTAIQHQLEEDDIEIHGQDTTPEQVKVNELIAGLEALQERILKQRNGQPVDVDALLDQLREERDEESLSMC